MSHCPESNHCPTKRSHLSAEPSVPASGTDNSRSFDRESVSLSHVPTPVPQADETPRLEHKLLLVHKILFKMSHCLMYRITFPQVDEILDVGLIAGIAVGDGTRFPTHAEIDVRAGYRRRWTLPRIQRNGFAKYLVRECLPLVPGTS